VAAAAAAAAAVAALRVPAPTLARRCLKLCSANVALHCNAHAYTHTNTHSNENLLVCAPTGAGKTNIAMIAVLREVGAHMTPHGAIQKDAFKASLACVVVFAAVCLRAL
jgi:replicative superfamily II helicase